MIEVIDTKISKIRTKTETNTKMKRGRKVGMGMVMDIAAKKGLWHQIETSGRGDLVRK